MATNDIDDGKVGAITIAVEEIAKTPIVESLSPDGKPNVDETIAGLPADAASKQPFPSPLEDKPTIEQPPPAPPIIPRVRTTNYEGFKNYYSEDDSCFAIEVLEVGADIKDQIIREKLRQGRPGAGGRRRNFELAQLSTGQSGATSDKVWIQRIRIQSRFILAYLRLVTGQSWDIDTPRTFYRPFSLFIHCQPKMKEILRKLRATWAAEGGVVPSADTTNDELEAISSDDKDNFPEFPEYGELSDDESSDDGSLIDGSSDNGSNAPAVEVPQSVLNSHETFKHMECYVDFVDKHIIPLQDLFKGTSRQKVRYTDLAYLFHPGDVVYSPTKSESTGPGNSVTRSSVSRSMWKVLYTNPPSIGGKHPDDFESDHKFYIHCYYIDYDGDKFGPVKYRFEIGPYKGEKDIKHLVTYPIRYFTDAKNLKKRLLHTNKNFLSFLSQKHLYYRGWTLITSPTGSVLLDSEGEEIKHPEHIDSNVIVDFKAALQSLPSWRSSFYKPSRVDEDWRSGVDDSMPVIQWTDRRRTKSVRSTTEATQCQDSVYSKHANKYRKADPFLVAFKERKTGSGYELSEDNILLLPGYVLAYVLRDRKFVQLDSRYIRHIPKQSNVFDSLKINTHHKEMVLALVDSHFRKMNKNSQHHSLGQDLIQGKGEGLVILLHGVPGVGKTATAEAVAQSNDRPLFVITCGDLGFTPKEVETSLEEIFRLAHLWDCILLLDEADIFLAQRTRDDLKRNALVSVFLRVLEYYSGILFLTTNRVGTLDEAFKSRIHMSLYYPALDRNQTLQIFEINIQRLEEIEKQKLEQKKKAENNTNKTDLAKEQGPFADPPLEVDRSMIMKFASRHYDKHNKGTGRWNGRQIRNAFQIASSLASYDMRKSWLEQRHTNPEAKLNPPVLNHMQFMKVAQATLKFENYMNDARGGDDQDLARIAHARADDHYLDEPPQQPPLSQQRRRDRQDKELRQDQRWFGAPPQTPGSNRRRSTFRELSQYENDQESSYEDPYDMEDDRGQRDRRTPTRSERSFRDDLDYGFDISNQNSFWEQNAGHRDESQEYKESVQGYRHQGQRRNPRMSQNSTPGDQKPPKFRDTNARDDFSGTKW